LKETGIVIVTGRLAEKEALKQAEIIRRRGYNVAVKTFNVDVALFINEKMLSRWINKECKSLRNHVIILPGASKVNPSFLANILKCDVRIVKGPIHVNDISTYMEKVPLSQWRSDAPVDVFLEESKKRDLMEVYWRLVRDAEGIESQHSNVKIPLEPPPFVPVAEVYVDGLFSRYLDVKLNQLIETNYPIVVVGSLSNNVEKIESTLKKLESLGFKGILGVDSPPTKKSINVIENTSAELFLSVDYRSLKRHEDDIKKLERTFIPVIIPSNISGSKRSRLASLSKSVSIARKMGLSFVLDPIVYPPNSTGAKLIDSLNMAVRLNEKFRSPVMLGLSNYIELVDADSPGLVFSLTQLSTEAKVSLGLFSEESYKTQGVFQEALVASIMNTYSLSKKVPPKNLGLDLLILKDKKRLDPVVGGAIQIVDRGKREEPVGSWDPTGHFNIIVDRERRLVLVKKSTWNKWIGGRSWRPIVDYILSESGVAELGHAFYLGREIYKAVLALHLEKDYVQDKRTFKKTYLEGLEKMKKEFGDL